MLTMYHNARCSYVDSLHCFPENVDVDLLAPGSLANLYPFACSSEAVANVPRVAAVACPYKYVELLVRKTRKAGVTAAFAPFLTLGREPLLSSENCTFVLGE
eukprot:Amastigsp_a175066_39.p1 type:complete len:102 gc:universal Amastigsp_a175066_39:308-3(-)